MEWLLIMQIIMSTNIDGSGVSINTVKFETQKQCEKAADVFLNKIKKSNYYRVYKEAECVQIK